MTRLPWPALILAAMVHTVSDLETTNKNYMGRRAESSVARATVIVRAFIISLSQTSGCVWGGSPTACWYRVAC